MNKADTKRYIKEVELNVKQFLCKAITTLTKDGKIELNVCTEEDEYPDYEAWVDSEGYWENLSGVGDGDNLILKWEDMTVPQLVHYLTMIKNSI